MVKTKKQQQADKQRKIGEAERERFRLRLIELRGERSQLEIGKLAGLHQSSYNEIERGRVDVSLSSIARIAVALGVPIGKLFE